MLFPNVLKKKIIKHIVNLGEAGLLPEDWYWHKDKIEKLEELDFNILRDLNNLNNSVKNTDSFIKLHGLVQSLYQELEKMRAETDESKAGDGSEAKAVNELINSILTSLPNKHDSNNDFLEFVDNKKKEGKLKVGDIAKGKLPVLSDVWLNVNNPSTIHMFIQSIENNHKYYELVSLAKSVSDYISVADQNMRKKLKHAVSKLPTYSERFMGMLYIALRNGIISQKGSEWTLSLRPETIQKCEQVDSKLAEVLQALKNEYGDPSTSYDMSYDDFCKVFDKYSEGLRANGIHLGYYRYGRNGFTLKVDFSNEKILKDLFTEKIFTKTHMPMRIHDRWLVEAFGLEEGFHYWDGETALVAPFIEHPSERDWDIGYNKKPYGYSYYIEKYFETDELAHKQILAHRYNTNKINELRDADTMLFALKEKLNCTDQELKAYLSVSDPWSDFPKKKNIVQLLLDSQYNKDGVFVYYKNVSSVEGDTKIPEMPQTEAWGSSEDAEIWGLLHSSISSNRQAVKYSYYSVVVVKEGKVIANAKLPPYFVYEDFPGGKTTHENRFRISKIVGVGTGHQIMLEYEDVQGLKHSVKI